MTPTTAAGGLADELASVGCGNAREVEIICRAVDALRAQERYKRTLQRIADPIAWEKENIPEGYNINYGALLSMLEKPLYYQDAAKEALRPRLRQERSRDGTDTRAD